MKSQVAISMVAFLIAGAGLAQTTPATDKKPAVKPVAELPAKAPAAKEPPANDGKVDPAKMMEMWEAMNKPTEMHKFLQAGVGEWKCSLKMVMMPGAPEETSQGTSSCTSILDGRFTKVDFHGQFDTPAGPQKFTGMGLYGFNTATKQFENVWVDSMSNHMAIATGTLSDDKKTLTWKGTYKDPMSGQDKKIKQIEKIIDDNTRIFEMYDEADGKEFRSMEITYNRVGKASAAPATKGTDLKPVDSKPIKREDLKAPEKK
jgi:hypothetical protein